MSFNEDTIVDLNPILNVDLNADLSRDLGVYLEADLDRNLEANFNMKINGISVFCNLHTFYKDHPCTQYP